MPAPLISSIVEILFWFKGTAGVRIPFFLFPFVVSVMPLYNQACYIYTSNNRMSHMVDGVHPLHHVNLPFTSQRFIFHITFCPALQPFVSQRDISHNNINRL
jgi:hypothetical protein